MTVKSKVATPSPAGRVRIKLLSQRGDAGFAGLQSRMPGNTFIHKGIEFTTDVDAVCDVVIVQNYLKYDTVLTARDGYIWRWDNEPIVRTLKPRGFDRVYSHIEASSDPQVHPAPPILDWWVDKSFDELAALQVPSKSLQVSAIASTKNLIPGHSLRSDFVETLEKEIPEIHLFGAGRERELRDKWDGLSAYKYSVAIENTSKRHYWTEKIADCFLSYTVPFYFGATNIDEYFPEQSYIWLPIDQPQKAIATLKEALQNDDWESRLSALKEAREAVLYKYSLYGQLSDLIAPEREKIFQLPFRERRIEGRRSSPGGWIRGVSLGKNLANQWQRILKFFLR